MTDTFYRAFEDRHRGPRELIKSRLRVYVPFFEPLKALYENCKAVDLGCGRGEWLELLREFDFDATGVDLDDGMLAACRALGLPAEQGEAIAFLRAMPDASLTIVSGFHIAEHIPFPDLQVLVQEALRVLQPAGLLILETPNPENIVVGTANFYLDPTHQRPLPPLLMSFLPEHYGFARTKILRLQEPSGLAAAAVVNLMDVLGGVSPDYAVVAQKKGSTAEQSELFDDAFEGHYGLELETLAMRHENGISGKLSDILSRVDRTAELEARIQAAEAELGRTRQQLAETRGQLTARDGELKQTRQQLAEMRGQLTARDAEIEQIRQQASEWNARVVALHSSTSWKLTKPVRAVRRLADGDVSPLRRASAAITLKAKQILRHGFVAATRQVSGRHQRLPRGASDAGPVDGGVAGTPNHAGPDIRSHQACDGDLLATMTPRARQIHADLKAAIEKAQARRR